MQAFLLKISVMARFFGPASFAKTRPTINDWISKPTIDWTHKVVTAAPQLVVV